MSEAARAVLIAGLLGAVVLLIPIGLLAAGVIGAGTMLAIQIGSLLATYLAAVFIRERRGPSE